FVHIKSDSNSANTDYKPSVNYESDNNYGSVDDYESVNNYESSFKKSEKEILIIDLTKPNSYLPFDDYVFKVANHNNINSNDADNILPINLITKNLRVGKIRYSTLPMEYLPTSEQGIAIVFNIGSWELYNIQYQRGHLSGGGNIKVVNMDTDFYQEENLALNDQKSKEMQTYTNIKNSHYSSKNKELIYELLEASTYNHVDKIFEELKTSNELNINNWISFYNTTWVKASLNPLFSFMDMEIWLKAPDNMNHYEHYFAMCNIQDKYGINKSGKNYDVIAREKQTIKRSVHKSQKTKRRINKPTKASKKPKVDIDSIQNTKNDLEIQEKQLSIKECELELEERQVRLEREKLEIIKLKKELGCE
ncbi:3920_t:CDS:2, partial [Racocetra persica]